jgi:hypothetical protein
LKSNQLPAALNEKTIPAKCTNLSGSKKTSLHTFAPKFDVEKPMYSKAKNGIRTKNKTTVGTTNQATADSLIATKPVIIKRQRIKHDTLYVEKTP